MGETHAWWCCIGAGVSIARRDASDEFLITYSGRWLYVLVFKFSLSDARARAELC